MPQDPKVVISGLYTNASDIVGGPSGGLTRSMNVDLSKTNVAQCRRGFDLLTALPDSTYRVSKLSDYQDYIYAYFNSTMYNYVAGAWVSRGAITKPTNALVPRQLLANNNLYVLSSLGLMKTDVYTTSFFLAGLPAGVTTILTESTAAGTAVEKTYTVNYRWLIATKDANNNLVQGPVSSSVSFYNSTGASNANDVCVLGYLPAGITGTKTVQVYRSAGLANQAISDELQLVYEYQLNSSNTAASAKTFATTDVNTTTDVITTTAHGFQDGTVLRFTTTTTLPAGISLLTDYIVEGATTNNYKIRKLTGEQLFITSQGTGTHTATSQVAFGIFDVVPDALRGDTVYVAPSQSGISQNNVQGPVASDIALYKEFAFFADTQSRHTFTFSLLSVDAGGTFPGLTLADTITISGEIYTAAATAVYGSGSGSFVVTAVAADVSASVRVDKAARSLVDVINRSSALVTATLVYVDSSSLPGKIRLEAKTLAASSFAVASTKQAAFNPQLPSTANSTSTSTSDVFRNGLMFSRQGLPEAVPPLNIFRVGSADDPILRIVALRDALLIFKRRDGCYVLRGENAGSFSVQLLDSTARLVAAESLAVVNGLVYGLFEAGICSVSDTSVEIVSEPIKNKIQDIYGTALDQVKDYSFGISYEAENLYILSIPTAAPDTNPVYQLVYNVAFGTFSEWDLNIKSGYVSSVNQKLYVANGNSGYVRQERKAFDSTDFSDYAGTKIITAYVGTLLTISAGIDSFSIGDLLSQGTTDPDAYVTSVDLTNSQVTVDYERTWVLATDDVDHYQGISCTIEWAPVFGDNPAGFKLFQEIALLFKQSILRTATLEFNSDTTSSVSSVEITGDSASAAWGVGTWGISPWGGVAVPEPIRIAVPRDVSRCNQLTVAFSTRVAQSDWQLQGMVPVFWPTSTRVAR